MRVTVAPLFRTTLSESGRLTLKGPSAIMAASTRTWEDAVLFQQQKLKAAGCLRVSTSVFSYAVPFALARAWYPPKYAIQHRLAS